MNSFAKSLALAGIGLFAGAGIASAAVVENDLNLRSGPGTNYRVIDVMPAGAYARVLDCGGSWCRVSFQGRIGWASANYLGGGRGAYAAAPVYRGPVYAAPPAVSFGFGWGRPHYGWRHHRWHRHRHWR